MTSKGKRAGLGIGMLGAAAAALLGKGKLGGAAPVVPEQAVASVKADVEEIKESAHR
jgi:hypothetical protein